MYKKYNVTSNITGIQNLLVSESIKDQSNVQLLKSEEAIRNVIESYSDKLNNTGGKLTDISKHLVNSKDIILTEQFNDLFNSFYIDLKTMYLDIQFIDDVLALNLNRNIKFFNILKKRINELWNKLILTRLNITDSSTFDESYFEGFSTMGSRHRYSGVELDKKTGVMTLKVRKNQIQNKRFLIKDISSVTYPVHNKEGGVLNTTSPLNQFETSYRRDGLRDMLENGLWKEQVLCNDVPDLKFDIIDNEVSPMYKNANGIVSIVDIEYIYPVEINTLELDFFGDYPTTVMSILVKDNADDSWTPISRLDTVEQLNDLITVDNFKEETSFDVMAIRNMETFKSKFLRIVFAQNNYDVLDNSTVNIDELDQKINTDMSQRRYEVVKLDGGADDKPAIPKSYDNDSLYIKITDVIENTRSLDKTINDIVRILNPPPKIVNVNLAKTLKYEIGAWEIKPSLKKYNGIGNFKSGTYNIDDRSLLSVSLATRQEDISYNTCNWFITHPVQDVNIPIIENKRDIRKEPAHIIKPQYYTIKGWNPGYFIHLDFPMDFGKFSFSKIYQNGVKYNLSDFQYKVINSTMIYIENISDPLKSQFVIQYYPAKFETTFVYVLEKIDEFDADDPLEFEIVAPRRALLKYFIDKIDQVGVYNVKLSSCTLTEYRKYFSNGQNLCMAKNSYDKYKDLMQEAFSVNVQNLFISDQFNNIGTMEDVSSIFIGSQFVPGIPIKIEREFLDG